MPTLLIDRDPIIDIVTYTMETPRANIIRHNFTGVPSYNEIGSYSEGRVSIRGNKVGDFSFSGMTEHRFNRIYTMSVVDAEYSFILRNSFFSRIQEYYNIGGDGGNISCDIVYGTYTIVKTEQSKAPTDHMSFEVGVSVDTPKKVKAVQRGIVIFKR